MASAFKVFIAESNGPEDFYIGQLDGFAANEVLKVRRITGRYRVVFNREMLNKAINEAVKLDADIFHLSCHGNEDGIQLTDQRSNGEGEFLSWEEVAADFQPFATKDKILVNSSCGGGHGGVSEAFSKVTNKFGFICGSTADTVTFHDSCLAWSVLYNVLVKQGLTSKLSFQEAITKINKVVSGDFVYRRWDSNKKTYRHWTGKE